VGCINVREGDGVVTVVTLDSCGRGIAGPAAKLVTPNVSEISWQDTINEGQTATERNFGGRKCYTGSGSDEMENIQVNLTTCGIIPALDSFLMGSNAKTSGTVTTGFGRTDLSSSVGVAVEILIQLDADACAPGATAAPLVGILFPLVRNWRPGGQTTLNGEQLVKPQYQGKGYKNALLDEDGLPDALAHWAGVWDPSEWYTLNVFDAAEVNGGSLPTGSCEPAAVALTGS
jgi:hypothetical protein